MAGIADPEVFWSMTPHEINLVIRGFRRRLCMYQAVTGWGAVVTLQGMGGSGGSINPPFSDEDVE